MKKQKTVKQQKNHYNRIEKTAFCGEFVSIAAPFITIGAVNYDKYFVQYNGTKMSISFIMALAVMGLAIWSVAKKKLDNTFTSLLIKWVTFAFIFQMMGSMITDLATIMWFGLIGLLGSFGLDTVSKKAKSKKERIIEAMKKAEDENASEQYKEEMKDAGNSN